MDRTFVVVASALGFLGVALGAFGAHALRETLTPRDLEIFETAVRYQLIHAVALLGVAAAAARWPDASTLLSASGWLMVGGIVVFSGSLYTLVGTGIRSFGAITPIGGVALLAGWATLGWAALRSGG